MSTWIVGDLHGCATSFEALRHAIDFDETRDTLFLVGDLINRGPRSLDTLRWVFAHRHSVRTVLGNHDIHLLWCALGATGAPHGRDTILDVLQAPDAQQLIQWLRAQPFARLVNDALIVHAGIHPHWRLEDALDWSDRLQERLQAPSAGEFLDRMRTKQPRDASDAAAFNAMDVLTRMRTLHREDLSLNTQFSGALASVPESLIPWFRVQSAHPRPPAVFFGHWAALGFHQESPYIGLDSGCVWDNGLTAWRLEDGHHVFQPAVDRAVAQSDGERAAEASTFPKQGGA